MRNFSRVIPITACLLAISWSVDVIADPPSHAPAHGWRAKHDPLYLGYTGNRWGRDYGILTGRCDRETVGTVLGGVIGGVIGSKVGDRDNRTIAILVGVTAGALIGRKIGRELDEGDRACFGHALEVGKPGQVITWSNPASGMEYQMALDPDKQGIGDDCRSFSLLGISDGKKSFRKGTACQQEPGVWQLAEPSKT